MKNLISPEYQAQIEKLHQRKPWGGAVRGKAQMLHKHMLMSGAKSMLDYGCGRSDLRKELEATYGTYPYILNEYEPGLPELADDPPVSDAVISFDVLEHVEPDKVDNVIKHIHDKCNMWTFHKICLRAATGVFPVSGQNLHLTIKPGFWWLQKFEPYFEFLETNINEGYCSFLALKK
mgnify:FL=1